VINDNTICILALQCTAVVSSSCSFLFSQVIRSQENHFDTVTATGVTKTRRGIFSSQNSKLLSQAEKSEEGYQWKRKKVEESAAGNVALLTDCYRWNRCQSLWRRLLRKVAGAEGSKADREESVAEAKPNTVHGNCQVK
jgi:hypothetical protein